MTTEEIEELKARERELYIPQEHPYKEFIATIVAILAIIGMHLLGIGMLFMMIWLAIK